MDETLVRNMVEPMGSNEEHRRTRRAIESKLASGELDLQRTLDESLVASLPELRRVAANRRQAERNVAALRLD